MLCIKDMSISYGEKLILKNVNMQLSSGDCAVIMGESGSGKTSLLNMVALRLSFKGKYTINKRMVMPNNVHIIKHKFIAYSNQENDLFSDLSVLCNLMIYKRVSKIKIMQLLKIFHLTDKKAKFINQLSGGERQRVSIIKSMVKNKKILVLDEPTASLDDENIQILIKLLQQVIVEEKKIILMATHDYRLLQLANKIFEIKDQQLKPVKFEKNLVHQELYSQEGKSKNITFNQKKYLRMKLDYNMKGIRLKHGLGGILFLLYVSIMHLCTFLNLSNEIIGMINVGRYILLYSSIILLGVTEILFMQAERTNIHLLLQEGMTKADIFRFYMRYYHRVWLLFFIVLSCLSIMIGESFLALVIAMILIYGCTFITIYKS